MFYYSPFFHGFAVFSRFFLSLLTKNVKNALFALFWKGVFGPFRSRRKSRAHFNKNKCFLDIFCSKITFFNFFYFQVCTKSTTFKTVQIQARSRDIIIFFCVFAFFSVSADFEYWFFTVFASKRCQIRVIIQSFYGKLSCICNLCWFCCIYPKNTKKTRFGPHFYVKKQEKTRKKHVFQEIRKACFLSSLSWHYVQKGQKWSKMVIFTLKANLLYRQVRATFKTWF